MASPDKILIVEDDPEIGYMLSKSFSFLEYKTTLASDGFQAIERLEAEQFNVVLLDLMLPGIGGVEILKRIRRQWPQTEVIMLTAYASLDTALDALRLGAYDYVTKPFEFSVVRSTVRRAMEKRRMETNLTAIYDLSREMTLSLTVEQVVGVVLDIVERVLELEVCSIGLIDEEQDELYLLAARDPGQEAKDDGLAELHRLSLSGDVGVTVAVARDGEPVYVPDVREERRYVEVRAATRSELIVPLKVKERVIGVLDVESADVDAFSQADVRILSTLAAQAAVAIENARLHERAQQEIAERARAEEALRESELKFRNIVEQSSDGIILVDERGIIIEWNQSQEQISGLKRVEVVGRPLWDVQFEMIPQEQQSPTMRQQFKADTLELLDSGRASQSFQGMEQQIQRAGGIRRFLQLSTFPIKTAKGFMIGSVIRDVTERKLAEEGQRKALAEALQATRALRESEEAERAAREQAETLRQATAALASTLDLDMVLDGILTHLEQVIPFVSASVFLYERGKAWLRVMATKGLSDHEQVIGLGFPADTPLWLELKRTQRPLILHDAQTNPYFERWSGAESHRIRGWMGVPLIAHGDLVGYLTLDSHHVAAYSEAGAALAQAFANQAAAAIQNARLFEQVHIGRERLQALSHRHVEAQEAERSRIARELHDETGQALSAMLLGLSLFEREVDRPDAVIARAVEMGNMVDEMLENLHRLAMNLRPASLDLIGLTPALGQYIETFGKQHNIVTQFETLVGVGRERLPPPVETALYRIVQEALTNVARHAQATFVDVLLERRGDQIVTIIEDDGAGFDVEEAMRGSRLGLFGMRERAEMLAGALTIESTIEAGTTVIVEIPYDSSSGKT